MWNINTDFYIMELKMSYRNETELKDMEKCDSLLEDYPNEIGSYIRSIEFVTTAKTRLEYAKDICKFYDYVAYIENIDKKDISTEFLDGLNVTFYSEYLHFLRNHKINGKVYSNSDTTIKRKLSALRSYFTYLFEMEYISSNQVSRVSLPKLREKEIIRMNSEETVNFINTVDNGIPSSKQQIAYHKKQTTRDMAIVYLLLSTGMRVSELVGLDLNDIDLKRCSVHIIRKGGREATVWFSDEAKEYLVDYIEERKKIKTADPEEKALFLSSRRKRISVGAVEVLIKKYARQSVPSKHITPHKMRSTFGTALYEKTGDIYLVADSLGHSDISTTKKHYADLTNKRKKDARNIVRLKDED